MEAGGSHVHGDDPRPLKSYAGILASYGVLAALLTVLLRGKRFRLVPLSPWNFLLYALSAEHLSRLISKDSVMSPVRKPFTQFKGPAGEGEVNEEVIGHGARHAIGELLTCPFCLDQWVTSGLVAGSVAAPTLTTAVVSVSAVARAADYLHLSMASCANESSRAVHRAARNGPGGRVNLRRGGETTGSRSTPLWEQR
jgi:hypothetical protein